MNNAIFKEVDLPKNSWKWALVINGREVCLGLAHDHLLPSQRMLGGEIVRREPVAKVTREKKRFAR